MKTQCMGKKTVCLVIFAVLLAGCGTREKQEVLIEGKTMGTFFHIKVVTSERTGKLEEKISQRLKEINRSMSTYDPDSEISRFNRISDTESIFPISQDFMNVMKVAAELWRVTQGAWDGTVDPLVNLWGFGRRAKRQGLPEPSEIQALLPHIGFHLIEILPAGLRKTDPAVTLDLASIAKGYGVDEVAKVIAESGIKDFLVEIGGEIYASGLRLDGKKWRIGINRPKTDAAFDEVYKVAELHNKGFATSGDYRNFFLMDGKRYSHVIDPRTGFAVSNHVVSASVTADTCTFADGLATALMVMGAEKSLELASRLENVECLVITEEPDGSLKDHFSKGFERQ
ncbi:MAG: FAD:protein FMN transferase [Desulfobacterales bacterium]